MEVHLASRTYYNFQTTYLSLPYIKDLQYSNLHLRWREKHAYLSFLHRVYHIFVAYMTERRLHSIADPT